MKTREVIGISAVLISVLLSVLIIKDYFYYSNIERNGVHSTGVISDITSFAKRGKVANNSKLEGLLTYYVNGYCLRQWVNVPVGYRIFNSDPKQEVSIKYDPANPKSCIVTNFYKPKNYIFWSIFTIAIFLVGIYLLPIHTLLRNRLISEYLRIAKGILNWKTLMVLYSFFIIITLTYVPWIKDIDGNKRHLGYYLIWNAPAVSSKIDYGRVILVCISITISALILCILFGLNKPRR